MNRRLFKNHRNPVNLIMHLIGVPLVVAAIPTFGKNWALALGMLIGGILIQEFGHTFENEGKI